MVCNDIFACVLNLGGILGGKNKDLDNNYIELSQLVRVTFWSYAVLLMFDENVILQH